MKKVKLCLAGLMVVLVSSQIAAISSNVSSYDPWIDYNDDGTINIFDAIRLTTAYGTSGTPFAAKAGRAYDSGWVNITDKQDQLFNITHNVGSTRTIVEIRGRITEDGKIHQSYLDATGVLTPGFREAYGGTESDYALSVVQTSDGGYALAGTTDSFGLGPNYFELWLVKTNDDGNMQWNKTYGFRLKEANSLVQTSDGGYALAGYYTTPFPSQNEFALVKTDADGNMQWNKTYGGTRAEKAYSVVQTGDGGYAIAGYTETPAPAPATSGFWLVKTDLAGNMEWNKTYGGEIEDIAYSMVQTGDGGYALAGNTFSLISDYDFRLVKTDADGNMQWNKTYGGYDADYCYSVVQTNDGGYALAGYTYMGSPDYTYDFWLVKTDSVGIVEWDKTYGGIYNDYARSVVQTNDGGYAIAGSTEYAIPSGGSGSYDFWLVKTDADGNMEWDKTYIGAGIYESARSIVQTDDSGYAIAGYTTSFGGGNYDAWLVKTDAYGLTEPFGFGLAIANSTPNVLTLYRCSVDPYWNYVRVRIWVLKEAP